MTEHHLCFADRIILFFRKEIIGIRKISVNRMSGYYSDIITGSSFSNSFTWFFRLVTIYSSICA